MGQEYVWVGTFMTFEAKRLLAAFGKAGIRVQMSVDDSMLRHNDLAAYVGGGHGVKVVVAVHRDDHENAREIMFEQGI